jgi:hypothetical protein
MAFGGVRNSCERVAKNSSFVRFAMSAASLAAFKSVSIVLSSVTSVSVPIMRIPRPVSSRKSGTLAKKPMVVPRLMQKTKLWHDAKRDHFYDGDIDRFKEFVPSLLHPTLSGRDDLRALIARQYCRRLRIK